ncbi:MAG: hypothetical protein KatS3mg082_1238 [Nitrospiraceae bacterium]|nr:MAG: hypothetical protein KatS3mg082_1238 [Nitrospiraceae bacterium]
MSKHSLSQPSAVVAALLVLAYTVAGALMSACGLPDIGRVSTQHAHHHDQGAKDSFCAWACQAHGGTALTPSLVAQWHLKLVGRVVHGEPASMASLPAATRSARGPPQ